MSKHHTKEEAVKHYKRYSACEAMDAINSRYPLSLVSLDGKVGLLWSDLYFVGQLKREKQKKYGLQSICGVTYCCDIEQGITGSEFRKLVKKYNLSFGG